MKRYHRGLHRSGLEDALTEFLNERQSEVRYEKLKIEWEDLKYRTYTPDYELDNGIIIEAKGLFSSEDRQKHLAVKKQHPELDIRFVFSNANAKLYKGAKTRYFEWCEKHGFKWSHRTIPQDWLEEPGSVSLEKRIALKTERRDK